MIKKKKKVLIRITSMAIGGAQKVLLTYLNKLSKEKYTITVLLNVREGELLNAVPSHVHLKSISPGIPKWNIPGLRLVFRAWRRVKVEFYSRYPRLLYLFLLRNEPFDIEIAFFSSSYNYIMNSPLKQSKKIAWIHGDFSFYPLESARNLVSNKLMKFDQSIFVSRKVEAFSIGLDERLRSKSCTIHNPIDFEDLMFRAQSYEVPFDSYLVSVGRLSFVKGYDLLIEAFAKARKKGFNRNLLIIGDGPEMPKLKGLVDQYEMGDCIQLLGFIDNPMPYIAKSDAYVQSSVSEAYPTAVLEASLLGVPVLATNVGGTSEIVDENLTGLLDEPNVPGLERLIWSFNELESKLQKTIEENLSKTRNRLVSNHAIEEVERIFDRL